MEMRWGVVWLLVAVCAGTASRTYVTGLWDLKRGELESRDFKRSFQTYLDYFKTLLQTHDNLIVFGEPQLQQFVQTHRPRNNTLFVVWEYGWFRQQWHSALYADFLAEIKADPRQWAKYSWMLPVQLEHYNDVVMAKYYLMLHALEVDPFQSAQLVWIDAGLSHVYSDPRDFVPRISHGKLWDYFQGGWMHRSVSEYKSVEHSQYYSKQCVREWVGGGIWGGPVEQLPTAAAVYENLMRIALERRHVYTE